MSQIQTNSMEGAGAGNGIDQKSALVKGSAMKYIKNPKCICWRDCHYEDGCDCKKSTIAQVLKCWKSAVESLRESIPELKKLEKQRDEEKKAQVAHEKKHGPKRREFKDGVYYGEGDWDDHALDQMDEEIDELRDSIHEYEETLTSIAYYFDMKKMCVDFGLYTEKTVDQ